MPKTIDRTGQRFGRLVAIRFLDKQEGGSRWLCQCDCGNTTLVAGAALGARVNSCGCWRRDRAAKARTHGLSKSGEYQIYQAAKKRCSNPNDSHFELYGGRGIEFRFEDFPQFLVELGPRPSDYHSVDRIDNNGHYEPGNVRWATASEQSRNKRNARLLTFQGRTQCVLDWAIETGMGESTIRCRIDRLGWSVEEALSTPSHMPGQRRPKP